MENLKDFVLKNRWPTGFADSIMESRDRVAYRFVVVDNSRSMLKHDGHRLLIDRYGIQRYRKVVFARRLPDMLLTISHVFAYQLSRVLSLGGNIRSS
jgi:hypothetical protein